MKTPDEVAGTVRSHARPGSNESGAIVAFSVRGRSAGAQLEVEQSPNAPALRTPGGGSSHAFVAFAENQRGELRETPDAVSALSTGGVSPDAATPPRETA